MQLQCSQKGNAYCITQVLLLSCRYWLNMQYFQIKLGFAKKEQSQVLVMSGLSGIITQLVILRILLKYAGKSGMLIIGVDSFTLSLQSVLCNPLMQINDSTTPSRASRMQHLFSRIFRQRVARSVTAVDG